MPTWWPELKVVPHQGDIHGFARRVRASFQVPMACCWTSKGHKHDTLPLAPHCMDCDAYLPWMNMKFGSVHYRICQPQKTLAYARTLQYWVEQANPPMPG